MRHNKVLSLFMALMLSLIPLSATFAQSSTNSTQSARAQLISKCTQATQEVINARRYIKELETQADAIELETKAQAEAGTLADAERVEREKEVKELRQGAADLKDANAERVKEIAKMQKRIHKLEGQVSFWRKAALGAGAILAAGAAAVVLLR